MKVAIVEDFYYTLLYTFYIMYLLVVLNLAYFKTVTAYLPLIQSALKYFVILFLMFRFNPYSHETFTEFDKKIVFSSSLFLLSTTAATDFLLSYFNNNISKKFGIDIKKMWETWNDKKRYKNIWKIFGKYFYKLKYTTAF